MVAAKLAARADGAGAARRRLEIGMDKTADGGSCTNLKVEVNKKKVFGSQIGLANKYGGSYVTCASWLCFITSNPIGPIEVQKNISTDQIQRSNKLHSTFSKVEINIL